MSKKSSVAAVPADRYPLSPYLVARDCIAAVDFYKAAFGAKEHFRLTGPDGRIGHAELDIAGGRIMIADEYPDFGAVSPVTLGGTPVRLHLYVSDVDQLVESAEQAGATVLRRPQDQFFGERNALIADPFGHQWFLSSMIEDVSPAEMQRRWSAASR